MGGSMKLIISCIACLIASAALFDVGAASAAEIKVFSSLAFSDAWRQLKPQFEARSHQLTLVVGTSGMMSKRVGEGEVGDVILSTTSSIDALIKGGRIVAGSRRPIAGSGVGTSIREGAPQ